MAPVSFAGVSKRYGAVTALDTLDLEILDGEFVSLLGPSGSGKSTTLNLLAGLQGADGGEIRVGQRVVNDVPPDKRDIALVFQNYALYPHLTVFENLAFPLEARRPRPPAAAIAAKVEGTAATLGIAELLARYPKEISGGQQQRVALGRAMVRDPKVFLLDEPLSNLDARLRIRMRRDLKALHGALRSTIVYVTHDQAEAMTLSDRIAIFDQGRLQQVGTPADIYDRPANIFVASFVGDHETNLLEGEVAVEAEGTVVRGRGFALRLSRALAAGPDRRQVLVGIRPEAIVPTDSAGPNTVAASVVQTELAGPDLYLFARLDGGGELACRIAPDVGMQAGRNLRLALDEARIHLFEPATGACISHGAGRSAARPPS